MRTLFFRTAAALCLFVSAVPLYADMDSFKDAVESAEEENREKEHEKPAQEKKDDDDGALMLIRLFFEIFGRLWLYSNDISYGPYPYCPGGFVRRPAPGEMVPDGEKDSSYSLGLSGLYLSGVGGGSWLSFSGNLFRFIGPYADVFLVTDGEDLLNGFRIGAHLSLFQSNFFNAALYIQYQLWYGFLQRDACAMGFEFRLYPLKPLSFRAKFGFQLFEHFTLGDIELEVGCMIGGWELFAGYRWWQIAGDTPYPLWSGPLLGLRRYL
jgi:hypothetical protein